MPLIYREETASSSLLQVEVHNHEHTRQPAFAETRHDVWNSATERRLEPLDTSKDTQAIIPESRAQLIERLKATETRERFNDEKRLKHTIKPITLSGEEHATRIFDHSQSALHSGVFQGESNSSYNHPPSPIHPHFSSIYFNKGLPVNEPVQTYNGAGFQSSNFQANSRIRGQSISSLSSYVLKQPTSPLAHSLNSDWDKLEDELAINPINISSPRSHHVRRPSLVQQSFSSLCAVSPSTPPNFRYNYQSRPSIPDNWQDVTPVPGTYSRQHSRKISSGSGLNSDLPSGSFVGSYEESILNGRMSTTPSKPLDFLAKIGVLGLGDCKASLKCPMHLTLPFPAYFYSVGDYDSPSPYVGQIDLETALTGQSNSQLQSRKSFHDGGYRLPQKGQLQIVIKNPNKTAVKLFLIPYDLKDMAPGTKTFIRQKSYSADILTEVLQMPSNLAFLQKSTKDREREALRYLIHLHICCPSRGKYYLYKNIRVVFANRVPDGKEKLRVETQQPSPKYSPWKSGRGTTGLQAETQQVRPIEHAGSDNKHRRRSSILFSLAAQGVQLNSQYAAPQSPSFDEEMLDVTSSPIIDEKFLDTFPNPLMESTESLEGSSYDKLSSSIYSNSSSKSDNSQGLIALKLGKQQKVAEHKIQIM